MKKFINFSLLTILYFTSCYDNNSSAKNNVSDKIIVDMNIENMEVKTQQFIGSWELQEWTIKSKEGKIEFPFGEDAIGQINYESNGNMSVQIMKNNRPQFLSEDPLHGQPHEIVIAFKGFIAYSGNYEVNLNSKQVVHQIKISSFPNWVGRSQIRKFEFNEDNLTLSTDFIGDNKHKLIWTKINF